MKKWFIGADHLGGYMHRWVARSPFGSLRVHRILRSDSGRDFHDHPFHFVSLILTSGYLEHVPGCRCPAPTPCRFFGPGSIVHRRAEQFHRLELVNGPATTLVATSSYFRRWGFLLPDGTWTDADTYHRRYNR